MIPLGSREKTCVNSKVTGLNIGFQLFRTLTPKGLHICKNKLNAKLDSGGVEHFMEISAKTRN